MVAALSVMAGAVLMGCTPAGSQGSDAEWDIGEAPGAIMTAVPRVAGVGEPERSLNGFQYRLKLTLYIEAASPEPLTATELDAVVQAIWSEIPWEPNTIQLHAYVDGTQEAVDLRPAAAELEPLGFREASRGGAVSIYSMRARYGDWSAP